MSKFVFSNVLGVFILDEKFEIVDKRLFKDLHEYEMRQIYIDELKRKHKNLEEVDKADKAALQKVLANFKKQDFFTDFYERNLEITKQDIKNSVKEDSLLVSAVSTIEEIDKIINLLAKRLREWYELYNPEISKLVDDHEKFISTIIKKSKKEILEQLRLSSKTAMGADLEKEDINAIMNLANHVNELYKYKESLEAYIENMMEELCPNLLAITGASIGSKLIRHTGSLERLAILPASTIQILGAEKALFRHLTKKAKMPKYGIIFQHPLILKVQKEERGKAARALADKIAIAAKVDRFKGKFIAEQLLQELHKRFGQWK